MPRKKLVHSGTPSLSIYYYDGADEGYTRNRTYEIKVENGLRSIAGRYQGKPIQELAKGVYALAVQDVDQLAINNMMGCFLYKAFSDNYVGVKPSRKFFTRIYDSYSAEQFSLTGELITFEGAKPDKPYRIVHDPNVDPSTLVQTVLDNESNLYYDYLCPPTTFNFEAFKQRIENKVNNISDTNLYVDMSEPIEITEYHGKKTQAFRWKNVDYSSGTYHYPEIIEAPFPPGYKAFTLRSGFVVVLKEDNGVYTMVGENERVDLLKDLDEQATLITRIAG